MSFSELAQTLPPSSIDLKNADKSSVPFLLLDGGMGTALELMGHNIADSPLWSASMIEKNPGAVMQAHLDFLDAGADIIITNTYQASSEQFARAHTSSDAVPDICRGAVRLAADARRQFVSRTNANATMPTRPKIALSVGPYGATLPYAEEYDGMYPPPFGPHGAQPRGSIIPSPPDASNVYNIDSVPSAKELEDERKAEDALYDWHLRRIHIYADVPEIWKEVDIIAFETIPLAREARAIRRVMTKIFSDDRAPKPWWIAFTFPGGAFPQKEFIGGPPMAMGALFEVVFSPSTSSDGTSGNAPLLVPSAVGVNCTTPSAIPSLLEQMSKAMTSLNSMAPPASGQSPTPQSGLPKTPEPNTWLVVYPNGGLIYQPGIRKWTESEDERTGERWVNELINSVRGSLRASNGESLPWAGAILGGCCHTGPSEIRHLSSLTKNSV